MKRLRLLSAVFVLIALGGNSKKFVAAGEDNIKGDKVSNPNRRYW